MRVTVRYGSYNQRRYGRPWIGKITAWPVGGKPEIAWGSYLGDDNGGECEIDAEVGDIVRSGQRDLRKVYKSDNDWYIVTPAGTLEGTDAKGARAAWDRPRTVSPLVQAVRDVIAELSNISDDALLAECQRRGLLGVREVSNG